MNFIPVITDTHFGVRNDSPVMYTHIRKFFREVFWPALDNANYAGPLIHCGDLTDRRKYINFQTLQFIKDEFFEPARERNLHVYWALGNHDLPFRESTELSTAAAFGEYKNVDILAYPSVVTFNDRQTLLLPWICDTNRQATMDAIASFEGATIFGHLELAGFDMFRGVKNEHGMDPSIFQSFPLVATGHYHHKSTRNNIHYLGSPYEMIWSDYADKRGFHWWDTEANVLHFVQNPNHVFKRYVYNDGSGDYATVKGLLTQFQTDQLAEKFVKLVVQKKNNPVWYDVVVDSLLRIGAYDVIIVDESSNDQSLNPVQHDQAQDTMTFIHQFIDGMPWDNESTKRDVQSLMRELYHTASQQTILGSQ